MAKSPHTPTFIALLCVCLVLSLPTLGVAAWALYDGTVHYPELAERYDAYQQLLQDDPLNARQQWPSIATQNGWPTDIPEQYTKADIATQFVLMAFCEVIGLAMVIGAGVFGLLWRRSETKDK
ncbi:MAG: hypothetical protein AAGI37_05310 [Planctomycetota bacterium]